MNLRELQRIDHQYDLAKKKFPRWLKDPVHAVNILAEEIGELQQAVNDFCYDDGDLEDMIFEAAQAGAMVIRFLEGVEGYERIRTFSEE